MFQQAVTTWTSAARSDVCDYLTGASQWEILRTRTSTVDLLKAADQGQALLDWMRASAQAWVELGVIERLAALEHETRQATGEGSIDVPDGHEDWEP